MEKVKVAIIDDGINNEFLFEKAVNYSYENGEIVPERIKCNKISHGTKCAQIFESYARHYILYGIKILNFNRETNIQSLLCALEWCKKNHIKLISLSLGSTFYADFDLLLPKIEQLIKKEILIIAAAHNNDYLTFPASINKVIGVRCDRKETLSEGEIRYCVNDFCGINLIVGSIENKFSNLEIKKHNSYVVPYVAAYILKLIQRGIFTIQEVDDYIKKNLIEYNNCEYLRYFIERETINIICYKNDNKITDIIELVDYFRKQGYHAIMVQKLLSNSTVWPYCIRQKILIPNSKYLKCLNFTVNADLIFWYCCKEENFNNIDVDGILHSKKGEYHNSLINIDYDIFDKKLIFEEICRLFS